VGEVVELAHQLLTLFTGRLGHGLLLSLLSSS
jgi:hypothetical protein